MNEKDENIIQLKEDKELLETINEQQKYYISSLNKNFNYLIEYCKKNNDKVNLNNEILNNFFDINEKINNEFLNKLETKDIIKLNNKKYLPYSLEYKQTNDKNILDLNSSINSINNQYLSSEEKIKELKIIIKEKEDEIKILKLLSQKFLSNSCESNEGKINIEQIKKDFKNGFELYSKIKDIEKNKNILKKENEKLKGIILEFQKDMYKINYIFNDIKKKDNKDSNDNKYIKDIKDLDTIISQLINNINNIINENYNIQQDKTEFNQKIQEIIKEKNEYLIKMENSLNNVQLIKRQYKKKDAEKKFINKFINTDK